MKIPDIKGLFSIARSVLDPKAGRPADQQAADAGKADKVELSSQSQTVQKLAAERPDARRRAAEVEQLKEAHARGELDVDAQRIAEEMVADGLFDDIIEGG